LNMNLSFIVCIDHQGMIPRVMCAGEAVSEPMFILKNTSAIVL